MLNDPRYLNSYFLDQQERTSLYEHSDFTFGSIDWSTEVLYTQRQTTAHNWRQFFPIIGGSAFYDVPGPYTSPAGPTTAFEPVTIWPSNQSINVKYYYLTTGLKGGFGSTGYLSTWNWNADVNFSRSDGTYEKNQILKETAGDAAYASPSDGLYHGPNYNPFDPGFLSGNYSSAVYTLLTEISKGKTTYDQTTVSGWVTGDLFQLPAGPLGVAPGAEYRKFKINDIQAPARSNGDYWGTSSRRDHEGQGHRYRGRLVR